MSKQGESIINDSYFDSVVDRINGCLNCEQLEAAAGEALEAIQSQQAAIAEQLAKIAPMLALLSPPGSPTAVITWIKDFIEAYLTPSLKPSINYSLQLAQLTAKIAAVSSAISSASGRIGCSLDNNQTS